MSPGTAARRYNTTDTQDEMTIIEDRSRALVPFTTNQDSNKFNPTDSNMVSKFTSET